MSARPDASSAGTINVGDFSVNRLGFGAMRITGTGVWGEPPDPQVAISVLRHAVEWGVNFIDTADSYGPDVSEQLIAAALYPYPVNLVISTKAGMLRPGPGMWERDGRPEHIRAACEGSLKRLRLDQIAVYHFHRPDEKVPFADSLGAFIDLQREGKVRHIALSNVTEAQLEQARGLTEIVCVQNRYHVADRASERLVDICAASGMAFIPWAPMQEAENHPALATIAERHNATPRQVVVAWLLARSPSTLPIPGTGSPEHLESNLRAASIALTPEEVETISAAN